MSTGAVLLTAYVLPSLLALLLSYIARSRVARHLLRWPAVLSLLMSALAFALHHDCQQAEFTYYDCRLLPEAAGDLGGIAQILYVVTYVTAGPVLLVAALILEILARRRRR